MNKQKGNMYGFVSHTWNPIKGKCSHDCSYCYMKRWGEQKPLRLDEKDLKTDLGSGNLIFVGSSTDMWAWDVPEEWISAVLIHCSKYQDNKYLFQTKNPYRFTKFYGKFPENVIFTTTMESNRYFPEISKNSPPISERYCGIHQVGCEDGGKVMITIEPITDFDHKDFLVLLHDIEPFQVNIGADSQGYNLPKPSKEKIQSLIKELKKFTKVHLKANLKRLTR